MLSCSAQDQNIILISNDLQDSDPGSDADREDDEAAAARVARQPGSSLQKARGYLERILDVGTLLDVVFCRETIVFLQAFSLRFQVKMDWHEY